MSVLFFLFSNEKKSIPSKRKHNRNKYWENLNYLFKIPRPESSLNL